MIDKNELDKVLLESIPLPMALVDEDNTLKDNQDFWTHKTIYE